MILSPHSCVFGVRYSDGRDLDGGVGAHSSRIWVGQDIKGDSGQGVVDSGGDGER